MTFSGTVTLGNLLQIAVFVFGLGMLYQKLKIINGEVQGNKNWRHWANDKIVYLLTRCDMFHTDGEAKK